MQLIMQKSIWQILTVYLSINGLLVFAGNEGVHVEGKTEKDTIQLGAQTKIILTLTSPDGYLWQWPELTDRIAEKIEIIHQSVIDTVDQGSIGVMQLKKELIITSFDTGYHAIPPLVFQYKAQGDTEWKTRETAPFLLYVAGVDLEVDSQLRDIKGIVKAPLTFKEILLWILLVLLAGIGLWLYIRYIKKKREKISLLPKPSRPKIPPHTAALDALDDLRQKKLWQNGRIKEYHSELTDIIRNYLEGRYKINAMEMTTTEIMEASISKMVPSHGRDKLMILFSRADLVKFAKSIPLPGEHEDSFAIAIDFVRTTIPVPMETQSKPDNEKNIGNNNDAEK